MGKQETKKVGGKQKRDKSEKRKRDKPSEGCSMGWKEACYRFISISKELLEGKSWNIQRRGSRQEGSFLQEAGGLALEGGEG